MTTFSEEIVRAVAGTGSWDRVRAGFEAFEDPEGALRAANQEGLRGPLAHALIEGGLKDDQVRTAVHEEVVWNAQYVALLRSLDAALQKSGEQAIVLKGASLLPTVYGGKMGARVLSDIDLFVSPKTLRTIGQALIGMGYKPRPDEPSTFSQKGLSVDLHLEITGRVEGAFNFETEAIWQNSLPLADYTALRTLSPEDQWLQLAVHATKHSFRRWIWLLDLALVWPLLDCERWEQRARQLQAERIATYTAHLLREVVGLDPVPDLIPLNRVERAFLARVKERRASESLGKLIPIFSVPTWWGKLRYLLRFLRPQTPLQSQKDRLVQVLQMARQAVGPGGPEPI